MDGVWQRAESLRVDRLKLKRRRKGFATRGNWVVSRDSQFGLWLEKSARVLWTRFTRFSTPSAFRYTIHFGIAFSLCTRVNFRRGILRVDDHAEIGIGQRATQPAGKREAIANGLKGIGIQPGVDNKQIQFLLLCGMNGLAGCLSADDVAALCRELTLKDGSDDPVIIYY